jgi:hypothetical protein
MFDSEMSLTIFVLDFDVMIGDLVGIDRVLIYG